AEDGIRDRNVTGVQTCALPIYLVILSFALSSQPYQYDRFPEVLAHQGSPFSGQLEKLIDHPSLPFRVRLQIYLYQHLNEEPSMRSEERRVGKESKDRSSQYA